MDAFDNRGPAKRASSWRRRAVLGAVASLLLVAVTLTTIVLRRTPTAKEKGPAAIALVVDAVSGDADEFATEFFPLQGDLDLDEEQEGGEVVRVSLPRTTLLAFGLPMNDERALEPLQAEILVGEDGAARAIRFVNERP